MKKEKISREEKKKIKETKRVTKKKIDKTRLATQIIAGFMAFLMILGIGASFLYYFIKMI